jgi:methionyl-tRNA synthetase
VAEESYFFRLSDYAEALLALYEARPDFIRPEARRNEVISFVRSGLQDLSVSRLKSSVSWAIPVPDDPAHTIYIWLDALTNYITALGWGNSSAEGEREKQFDKFWPGVHLIGKDILRQHAIYWPAFLLAANIEQPLAIIGHGTWLDHLGRKMSKTLGNSIELPALARLFSPDIVRYFCLREMVFGQDSKFGSEAVIDRSNSDLASGLGNLSSRTLTMIKRYCDGLVPPPDIAEENRLQAKRAGVDADGGELASALQHARDAFIGHFEEFAFPTRARSGVVCHRTRGQDDLRREALGTGERRSAKTDPERRSVSRRRNPALARRPAASGDAGCDARHLGATRTSGRCGTV